LGLIFKEISNFQDFQRLKMDWNSLVKTTDVDHAFMKHEWFESWIKHLKPKSKMVIHTAWENNTLVAIAPLHIIKQKRKGVALRVLSFMRSSITPRSNFIVDDKIDSHLFFDTIFASKGWDVSELRAVEVGIPITNKFLLYLKQNNKYVIEDSLQSPYEILNTDWETYLKSKSKNFKKNYRNYINRLKSAESYKIIKIDDYNELETYFDSLINVSGRSWKAKGKTDLKSMSNMAEFYKDFSKLGSKDKLFTVIILIIDDKVVAFSYYLKNQNRLVGIRWEYDEDYSYYMPGLVLNNEITKILIDTNEKWEYDLSGMATEHKVKLTNEIRKHIDITVGRPGLYGNFIMYLKKKLMRSVDLSDKFI